MQYRWSSTNQCAIKWGIPTAVFANFPSANASVKAKLKVQSWKRCTQSASAGQCEPASTCHWHISGPQSHQPSYFQHGLCQ